jgi:hypothetical protein
VIQKYKQSSYVLILAEMSSLFKLISWVSLGYHNQHSALAIMVLNASTYCHGNAALKIRSSRLRFHQSGSYTQETFLSAPAAPQISPNRLMQPVWRAQRSITFTTSPRADAIRAYKRCASASTRVHRSHNVTISGASQTPTDRLANDHFHECCIWWCVG